MFTLPKLDYPYEALEPYYTRAEHLYQVHGVRGVDPTEPAASAPYRFPPVSQSYALRGRGEMFYQSFGSVCALFGCHTPAFAVPCPRRCVGMRDGQWTPSRIRAGIPPAPMI